MTDADRVAKLSRLLPAQFDELICLLKAPRQYLASANVPQAQRAVEVLHWAEASEHLIDLDRALDAMLADASESSKKKDGPDADSTPSRIGKSLLLSVAGIALVAAAYGLGTQRARTAHDSVEVISKPDRMVPIILVGSGNVYHHLFEFAGRQVSDGEDSQPGMRRNALGDWVVFIDTGSVTGVSVLNEAYGHGANSNVDDVPPIVSLSSVCVRETVPIKGSVVVEVTLGREAIRAFVVLRDSHSCRLAQLPDDHGSCRDYASVSTDDLAKWVADRRVFMPGPDTGTRITMMTAFRSDGISIAEAKLRLWDLVPSRIATEVAREPSLASYPFFVGISSTIKHDDGLQTGLRVFHVVDANGRPIDAPMNLYFRVAERDLHLTPKLSQFLDALFRQAEGKDANAVKYREAIDFNRGQLIAQRWSTSGGVQYLSDVQSSRQKDCSPSVPATASPELTSKRR